MNLLPIFIALLVAIAYILFWCGLMLVTARFSGWSALGKRFAMGETFKGKCWHFQHSQFRWAINYSGALTVGANETGLYLSPWPIFRVGHPRLFIPWGEMRIDMKQSFWLGDFMELQFPELPGIVIRFQKRLARRIAETVGPKLSTPATSEQPHVSAV